MNRTAFWPGSDAHLRCSDGEREQVAEFLRERAVEGRLTPDELDQRLGLAYRAVTIGDLERLVSDLPGSPFAVAAPLRRPARRAGHSVVAVVVLAVFAAVLLPGPIWVLLWAGLAVALVFGALALALGLTLAPFALAGAAVVLALRWLGGRSPQLRR